MFREHWMALMQKQDMDTNTTNMLFKCIGSEILMQTLATMQNGPELNPQI